MKNIGEDMLVAFWKYAAMQDISWSVALRKDVHMWYHQDVMLYKDWPMQVTKLSHFATIHELEISGMLVFSTIRRWKITEVSHFIRISGCESTKLSHSMRIGERNVTNMERVVCIIECMLSEERAAK